MSGVDKRIKGALNKAVGLLKVFDGVAAIGLSGSCSEDIYDKHSDLDICVFVRDRIPLAERREREYWN